MGVGTGEAVSERGRGRKGQRAVLMGVRRKKQAMLRLPHAERLFRDGPLIARHEGRVRGSSSSNGDDGAGPVRRGSAASGDEGSGDGIRSEGGDGRRAPRRRRRRDRAGALLLLLLRGCTEGRDAHATRGQCLHFEKKKRVNWGKREKSDFCVLAFSTFLTTPFSLSLRFLSFSPLPPPPPSLSPTPRDSLRVHFAFSSFVSSFSVTITDQRASTPAPSHSIEHSPPPPPSSSSTENLAEVSASATAIAERVCSVGEQVSTRDLPFASAIKMISWSCSQRSAAAPDARSAQRSRPTCAPISSNEAGAGG